MACSAVLLSLAAVAAVLLALGCAAAPTPPREPAPEQKPLPRIGSLWNFQDPAGTEARFREVLPAAEASGDRAYLCELTTQIARTQGLQMKFDEALRTLDAADAMLGEGMDRARAFCLLERGRVFNSSKRQGDAIPLFLKAWDGARAAGLDGLAVDAAHMVAAAGTPEDSREWNLRAIAFAEASSDPAAKAWLGSLYNNTGWDLHKAGRFEEALGLFERALRFREESKQPADVSVARWCLARCLRSLGRTEEALAMQRGLLAASEATNEPDGFVHEEMAECLLLLGKPDEAKPHFRRAWELLSKDPWLARDEPDRLARLDRLGK